MIIELVEICDSNNLIWQIKKNPDEKDYQVLIYRKGEALKPLVAFRDSNLDSLITNAIQRVIEIV